MSFRKGLQPLGHDRPIDGRSIDPTPPVDIFCYLVQSTYHSRYRPKYCPLTRTPLSTESLQYGSMPSTFRGLPRDLLLLYAPDDHVTTAL